MGKKTPASTRPSQRWALASLTTVSVAVSKRSVLHSRPLVFCTTETVNALPEVAHNYQRDHEMNMWFVLATETPEALQATVETIESQTGLKVFNLPKLEEFYVGLHFEV